MATDNQLESLFSREAAFLLNNFLILAILVATLLGVYFPVLTDLLGDKVTVGAPYYERVNGPLFGALVLLMGVAPLTMWHRTNVKKAGASLRVPAVVALVIVGIIAALGWRNLWALAGLWVVVFSAETTLLEFYKGTRARMKRGDSFFTALSQLFRRNQRRYGGYMIHLGVIIMAFGIIGIEFFQEETQLRLSQGGTVELGKYTVELANIVQFDDVDDLLVTEAHLPVSINGRPVKTLKPQIELYQRTGQPMTIPGVRTTFLEDLYIIMVNWEGISSDAATFRIFLNPLINWVWAGGVVFIIGTALAAWPDPQEAKVIAASRTKSRYAVTGD